MFLLLALLVSCAQPNSQAVENSTEKNNTQNNAITLPDPVGMVDRSGEVALPSPTPVHWLDIDLKNSHYSFTMAISVPQPLLLGVQASWDSLPGWEAYFEAGYFRYPWSNSSRQFADYSFQFGVRVHPFKNWFFIASELGYRQIGLLADISSLKQGGQPLASTAQLKIDSLFLALLVGGEWSLSDSLSFAFDLGLQFEVIRTASVSILPDPNDPDPGDLSVNADPLSRVSSLPLPQLALIRLIWKL